MTPLRQRRRQSIFACRHVANVGPIFLNSPSTVWLVVWVCGRGVGLRTGHSVNLDPSNVGYRLALGRHLDNGTRSSPFCVFSVAPDDVLI